MGIKDGSPFLHFRRFATMSGQDKKPEGHDDIPKQIPDPEAKKPDDWDDEDDGEWEAPKIANPDYSDDENLHNFCKKGCTHVGFELWQVKSGTLFDDIIVTDSIEEAKKFADETFYAKRDAEKKMAEKQEEEKKAKEEEEKKAKEEEEKKKEEEKKDED